MEKQIYWIHISYLELLRSTKSDDGHVELCLASWLTATKEKHFIIHLKIS